MRDPERDVDHTYVWITRIWRCIRPTLTRCWADVFDVGPASSKCRPIFGDSFRRLSLWSEPGKLRGEHLSHSLMYAFVSGPGFCGLWTPRTLVTYYLCGRRQYCNSTHRHGNLVLVNFTGENACAALFFTVLFFHRILLSRLRPCLFSLITHVFIFCRKSGYL